MKRRLIRDPLAAKLVGWAVFITGAVLLHDAYEGRGHEQPIWARPFTSW